MSERNDQDQDRVTAREAGQERSEMGLETPEEDAVEQHAAVAEEEPARWPKSIPFDANEADAADQGRPVELDEDDYR